MERKVIILTALVVTMLTAQAQLICKTTPLYLIITNLSVSPSDSGTLYIFLLTRQASNKQSERTGSVSGLRVGEKNRFFELRAVEGPTNAPTGYVLHLLDTDTDIKLTGKAFKRIDGYMADIICPPEKLPRSGLRVGDTLQFKGEGYRIVSISECEVVLSTPKHEKWTLKCCNSNTNGPNNPLLARPYPANPPT